MLCRGRSGKLLILRLTPRKLRRLRLELASDRASPRCAPRKAGKSPHTSVVTTAEPNV